MDPDTFRSQTLSFASAINRACSAHGSTEQIPHMNKYALPHFQWYFDLDSKSKRRIGSFMTRLDSKTRIDPTQENAKVINEGAVQIMQTVISEIERRNSSLAGNLYRMGSAWNGLKINDQDEIDFTYEMTLQTILGQSAKVKEIKSKKHRSEIYIDFGGERPDVSEYDFVGFPTDDPKLEEYLSLNGSKDYERLRSAVSQHGNEYVLNTEALAYALFVLLNEIVPNIDLPENWNHGGYNYPYFSGIRLHIPAFQLQFSYQHPENKTTVVSFDFAPVLKLPENFRYLSNDIVDEYLDHKGFIRVPWQRLERGSFKGGYYSLAEEKLLESYAFDSIAKTVNRICKALLDILKLSSPKYVTHILADRITTHQKLPLEERKRDIKMNEFMMTFLLHLPEISHVPSSSNYATMNDILENIGCHEYIPSYVFKKLILILIVLDDHNGRQWNENDIPDLVVAMFMIINDAILCVNEATLLMGSPIETEKNCFSYPIHTRSELFPLTTESHDDSDHCFLREVIEIPLNITLDENEIMSPEGDTPAKMKKSLLWYEKLHELMKKEKCGELANLFLRGKYSYHMIRNTLDPGIARIIALLKSISDGRSSASVEIKVGLPDDDISDPKEYLILKADLKKLLQRSND